MNLKEGWRPQRAQDRKGFANSQHSVYPVSAAPWSFLPQGYKEPLSGQTRVAEGSDPEAKKKKVYIILELRVFKH